MAATSPTKHMHTCKSKCMLSPQSAHTHIGLSSHCSSPFPWLSSLVHVGRLESEGRLNLSVLLTITVWQQIYRVKYNFTSSQMPQQGLIDPTWHHRGQRNGEEKLQSSADLAPDWGQVATRNGFSSNDGLMDVLGNVRIMSTLITLWRLEHGNSGMQRGLSLAGAKDSSSQSKVSYI